jgi:hypothetical protein
VEIATSARFSNLCKNREEVFSLRAPVCNGPLNVGVLDNRVWNANGHYVFNQDAVGQDLSDVAVSGAGLWAAGGFELDRDNATSGSDQIIWLTRKPIAVRD